MKYYSPTEASAEILQVNDQVAEKFSTLTVEQLNWKPNPRSWSIGQVMDHLIVSNSLYFPTFELIISGKKRTNIWEKIGLFRKFFGRFLINGLTPGSDQNIQAPKAFIPTFSEVDPAIFQKFIDTHIKLSGMIKQMEGLDLERIVISSPASAPITYTMKDCVTILTVHQQRHLVQMKRVFQTHAFPNVPE